MLEFYNDHIDVFVDRKDFELLQMDTDLLSIAISGTDLDEVVKPELENIYYKFEKQKCFAINKISEKEHLAYSKQDFYVVDC